MDAPLAWTALGLTIGTYAAIWCRLPWWITIGILTCSFILLSLPRRAFWCPALIAIGVGIAQITLSLPSNPVIVHGRISGSVQSSSGRFALLNTHAGTLRAYMYPRAPVPGTHVSGVIKPFSPRPVLPGGWLSHARATLSRTETVRMSQWIALESTHNQTRIPSSLKHYGLLHALATGDRSLVSEETLDLFRRTGVVHLLAISGLHVGIIASIFAAIGWALSRPLTTGTAVGWARVVPYGFGCLAAFAYGSAVSWPVSTQRAVCMLLFGGITVLLGRRINPWQILGGAVIAVFVVDPSQLASLGFLMSFSAVIALIGWMPKWISIAPRGAPKMVVWIHNSFGATLCASFGTLPICAWVFQSIPIAAPFANLVAVPLIASIAVPATLVGLALPSTAANALFSLADIAISLAMFWIKWFDFGTLHPAVGWTGAVLLWVALLCIQYPRLAIVCVVAALTPWPDSDQQLELYFPNVGQGGACLIKWPDGRHWLVDAGPPGNQMLHWLRRKRIATIDRLFLSHADLDHMGGFLPILKQMHVREIWISRPPIENVYAFEEFISAARNQRIPIHHWEQSTTTAGSDNDSGLVVTVRHGEHRFLLLGDIGQTVEARLADRMPPMTLVQVAHHGSNTSSSPHMIAKAQADYAVIQVGTSNRYGLPTAEVVERWSEQKLLRTDIHGSVRVRSDGHHLTISGWTPQDLWENRLD